MGKKAPKQTKAATNKPSTATSPKPAKQLKKKKEQSYDTLKNSLDRELALVGLRVKQITADGNCFFRALSDQLEGNEGAHSSLRARVVALMKEREEDFAPFVEDDQQFDAYIAKMKKEGVWAGHMELQAASLLLQANIHIYQAGQPRWAIVNFPKGCQELHLSYHDGEHYNSIRRADDYGAGPPAAIDGHLAAAENAEQLQQSWSAADEAYVMTGTGCDNKFLVQQQLAAAAGDVDAAIEAIIEILAGEGNNEQEQQQEEEQHEQQQQQQEHSGQGGVSRGLSGSPASATANSSGTILANETEILEPQHTQTNVKHSEVEESEPRGIDAGAITSGTAAAAAVPNGATCNNNLNSSSRRSGDELSRRDSGIEDLLPRDNSSHHQQQKQQAIAPAAAAGKKGVKLKCSKGLKTAAATGGAETADKRPSRNKPCACGSGRKHKNCCGMRGNQSGAAAASGASSAAGVRGAGAEGGLPAQLATLHI